jgi:hypothetical protein
MIMAIGEFPSPPSQLDESTARTAPEKVDTEGYSGRGQLRDPTSSTTVRCLRSSLRSLPVTTGSRECLIRHLAWPPIRFGSGRAAAIRTPYFLIPIRHYLYTGDTALHVAGAVHHRGVAETLIAQGAAVRARNQREPNLSTTPRAGTRAGRLGFECAARDDLLPHRCWRRPRRDRQERCSAAASSRKDPKLGRGQHTHRPGADVLLMNKSGSTPPPPGCPKHAQGQVGSEPAKEEQHRIIVLAIGAGWQSYRSRRRGQVGRGRRIEQVDPSTARRN